ncbi:MAG: CidA/LrgA family protein [Clostridia bacterium]
MAFFFIPAGVGILEQFHVHSGQHVADSPDLCGLHGSDLCRHRVYRQGRLRFAGTAS